MRNEARKKAHAHWYGMVSRCTNPDHPRYADYGARGITVCQEWIESFDAFYSCVGDAPQGLSLDRIDNDRGYEPSNVRWATAAEQAANRRASGREITHCPQGHEYTADNLVTRKRGSRDCKACHRIRQNRRYHSRGVAYLVRPKLLDLFCCEGGASEGYRRAGFDVYGVDLFKHRNARDKLVGFSQKRYPFPSRQHDAIDALDILLMGSTLWFAQNSVGLRLRDFAAIHASPPCQHASAGTRTMRARGTSDHPELIEPTRDRLEQTGLAWVIENVSGAALRDPIALCGSNFGLTAEDEDGFPLRLERHRLFESNIELESPGPCQHDETVWAAGVYGGARGRKAEWTAEEHRHSARYDRHGGYVPKSLKVQQQLLGIDWMTKGGMAQSLPPVYTQHIGAQLLAHLAQGCAA